MHIGTTFMMTNINEKKKTRTHHEPIQPLLLTPNRHWLEIGAYCFFGVDFKGWKRAVSIALSRKNKLGIVDESLKRSTLRSDLGKAWDRVNDIVLGWLLNSVYENQPRPLLMNVLCSDL